MTKIKTFDLTLKDGDRLSSIVYKCLASYKRDFFEAVKNGEFIAKLKGYESVSKTGAKTVKNFSSDQVVVASQLFYTHYVLPQKSRPDTKAFVVVPTENFVPVFDKEGHETGKEEAVLEFRIVYGEPTEDWEIETIPLPTNLLVAGRSGGSDRAKAGAKAGAKAEAEAEKASSAPKMESGKRMTQNQDGEEYEEALDAFIKGIELYLIGVFKAKPEQLNNFSALLKKRLLESVVVFKPVEKAKE